ncbi:MAG: Fe-S cluster assembly protein SufB [Candidatus Micrarchaeota archaeon]|nr:Fe-S cluster assembly protein SufB [Candidatus Micrarchaeota archaeon]
MAEGKAALNSLNTYKYGFRDNHNYFYRSEPGLTAELVQEISRIKGEPEWMLEKRLQAYQFFLKKPMPSWGADLSAIKFEDIIYYARPTEKQSANWDDVPDDIKKTFDKIGVPEAEKKFLGGVSSQYDSEVVYHNLKKEWSDQGIIFTDMDTAVREHPEIVKKYFGTVIPANDNKFASLNGAVWSGGSFIYVPKGVDVNIPLQAYFRINTENAGQFERTLIIADVGANVHYVEGCSAPIYTAGALHSAVVELIAMKNSHIRYTTIQNWSSNVYNLVTKRSVAYENALVEWMDGNIGSRVTMKYPSIILKEPGARGEVVSVAYAGKGQHQDAGAKIYHMAPNTTSRIISKSISKDGGRTTYRGLVKVVKGAKKCKTFVQCDAYMLDETSRSDTYPKIQINEDDATVAHEAKVGKISDEKLFYLMSRGIPAQEAISIIILGFIEEFTKELPMEYAVELNRLIQLELEGAVG